MEKESLRFWEFLINKKRVFLKKEDILKEYNSFIKIWNIKNNFKKVYESLRRNKIVYILNNTWKVLTKEEILLMKESSSNFFEIFIKSLFLYFDKESIKGYFGITSADYMNKYLWQSPHTYYILNNKFNKIKRIKNYTLVFIKVPLEIYIKDSLNFFKEVPFTNPEKTLLDKIYLSEYLKKDINIKIYEELNYERINLYLGFFKKYPLVKAKLSETLNDNQVKKIR